MPNLWSSVQLTENALIYQVVPGLLFIIFAVAAAMYWKRSAIASVRVWCEKNKVLFCTDVPAVFNMGNPPSLELVIEEDGNRYLCQFKLFTSFFYPFGSDGLLWKHVKLVSKKPFKSDPAPD